MMLINIHQQLEQKNPKIKPIKNKGWVHYESMKSFVPIKSHGRVTFSANIQCCITDTIPSTTSSGAVTPSPGPSFDEIPLQVTIDRQHFA
jgi:hypothetical protein